jgi:hypothetical protein
MRQIVVKLGDSNAYFSVNSFEELVSECRSLWPSALKERNFVFLLRTDYGTLTICNEATLVGVNELGSTMQLTLVHLEKRRSQPTSPAACLLYVDDGRGNLSDPVKCRVEKPFTALMKNAAQLVSRAFGNERFSLHFTSPEMPSYVDVDGESDVDLLIQHLGKYGASSVRLIVTPLIPASSVAAGLASPSRRSEAGGWLRSYVPLLNAIDLFTV